MGCGQSDALDPADVPPPDLSWEAPQIPPPPSGKLWRDQVDQTVDRGLGSFLHRHVDVEASLSAGRFIGFRIVELRPPEFWEGVELKPGDVVTKVNGKSVERDTQAFAIFEGLKKAKELRVSYQRGGTPFELVREIIAGPPSRSRGQARRAPQKSPAKK